MTDVARTDEQVHWDKWNIDRVNLRLDRTRQRLHEIAMREFQLLDLTNSASILDVACGAGWNAEFINPGYDYLGLDISPEAIAAAREIDSNARFEVADFNEWDIKHDYYDAIVFVDAIAYFADQAAVMSKIRAGLKQDGWLVMTTLNPFVYERWSGLQPPGKGQHRNWLTKKQLHALLDSTGFEIVESRWILPGGDRGICRWTESRKALRVLNAMFGERGVTAFKERVGLGQFRIVVARPR